MKSVVIYYSETGNTEKVAKAIAKGINCEAKKIEDFNLKKIMDYDLIFLGTPVHGFAPAKKVQKFLEEMPTMSGKKGAAFCTMHSIGDKEVLKIIKDKLTEKKISFIDGFSCLGRSRLVANFGPKIFNKDRPNEKDLKEAEEFGKKILKTASE
jgi:flavodoxin